MQGATVQSAASIAFALASILTAGAARGAGPVVGWGDNTHGQATWTAGVDGGSNTAAAVAAGFHHNCAIQTGNRQGRVLGKRPEAE